MEEPHYPHFEDLSSNGNLTLENISGTHISKPTAINETKGSMIYNTESLESRQGLCPHINDLSIKDNLTVETIAEQISKNLNEPNKDLIYKIVKAIGIEQTLKFYDDTRRIEQAGGIRCKDGSRRKKPGGVFFHLIHRNESIFDENLKKIFAEESQKKNKERKDLVKEQRKKRTEELRALIIENGLLSLDDRKEEV